MKKLKNSKVMAFLMFQVKHKPIQFPKHGEYEFPKIRESMRNPKHSEVIGFLYVSGETDIHRFRETCEKVEHIESKGKLKYFDVIGFVTVSSKAEIYTNPNTWQYKFS